MMRASMRAASPALQCFIAVLVIALVRVPAAQAAPAPSMLASAVLGATGPKVAVVVVAQDLRAASQQGALEGAAEAALERSGRFTVIPVHDAFNPAAATKMSERVEESRARTKAGKQALDDLDNVKATEAFTAATEALKESDLSRQFPALLEAWTMKAAGHATGGENGPAKKDIEAVVALAPKAEFSPTFFPPELIKFAEAQRKFAANAKGELLVRTEPPGARVWVDGTYRGVSPVTVAGLTSAKHFVAASLGGYSLGQSQASPGEEVLSLAGAELSPGWKKAQSDIKKDPDGATRDSAAQQLGKAAQLDQVLLVLAKKSLAGEQLDLIAMRLEVRDGHNDAYQTATVNAGDPEALASFFDGLTGKDAKRDGKDPVHHYKGAGTSPIKTIAGLSLIGVGAASVIAGTVFGVMAGDRATEFRRTEQTKQPLSMRLEQEGRTYAAVADITVILGLISAGGGTVLLLTNKGGGDAAPAPEPEKKPAAKAEKRAPPPSDDDDGAAKKRENEKKAADDRKAADERRKDDERRRAEEQKREDEQRRQEADAKAAEQKRLDDEEAARKKREEEEAKKPKGKLTKKQQREEDERKKKEEEERLKAEEQAKADAEKKRREEEARKRREAEEKKKKDEDHDDLRNY
jgi:hypothetical protein